MHSRISLGRIFHGAVENFWHDFTRHWSDFISTLYTGQISNVQEKAVASIFMKRLEV